MENNMQNPKLIPVPFANSGIKDEIPKVKSTSMSNEKASWEDGFPEATMLPVYAGGLPPDGKDFNGVLNQISENLVFQSKGGRYKFDPDFALSIGGYPKGATLQTNDESAEYQSLIDNNLVNFNTATSEEIAQSWRITGLGDATEVLNGKFDKASVKNDLGLSQTEVVSQNVVTELGSGIVGSFEDGLNFITELTNSDQLVTLENEFGKQTYCWTGGFPKQVPAGSTPQSTGGIGKGAWVSVGDASLRGDIVTIIATYPTTQEIITKALKIGSIVKTMGYYEEFDGGGSLFKITDQHPIEGQCLPLENGLFAVYDISNGVNLRQYGVSENNNAAENSAFINKCLNSGARIINVDGKFNVDLSELIIPSNIIVNFTENSELIFPSEDKKAADNTGTGLLIDTVVNVEINNIKIKNGYKGTGIRVLSSKNVKINNPTVDGFTNGIHIGEKYIDGVAQDGSQDIAITSPAILNARYWGLYIRGKVSDISKRTKDIIVTDPKFYNCNMAAFVVSEGRVHNIKLIRPTFNRCPVEIHLESVSGYEITGIISIDNRKYPDQVPCNTEYPFPSINPPSESGIRGWSIYRYSAVDGIISKSKCEGTITCYASRDNRTINTTFESVEAYAWLYSGAGGLIDEEKNFIEEESLRNCKGVNALVFQIESEPTYAYIKNLNIDSCNVSRKYGGNGTQIALNPTRLNNLRLINSNFSNAAVRCSGEGFFDIRGNYFTGTDNTRSSFTGNGTASSERTKNILNFVDNVFLEAGGVVIGDSVIRVNGWAVVQTRNTIGCKNGVLNAYSFIDINKLIYYYSSIYNTSSGEEYALSNVSVIKKIG